MFEKKFKMKLIRFDGYILIFFIQSSNMGQARIVGGGIGQRQISIIIEARSTLYFNYRAAIYGY